MATGLSSIVFCLSIMFQDYESKIATLQEQVERQSMMSSMTPDEFDDDEDDAFGKRLVLQICKLSVAVGKHDDRKNIRYCA